MRDAGGGSRGVVRGAGRTSLTRLGFPANFLRTGGVMRRVVGSSILAIVLAFSAATLSADSRPVLTGFAAGIELCPQFICGFALFAGQFQGAGQLPARQRRLRRGHHARRSARVLAGSSDYRRTIHHHRGPSHVPWRRDRRREIVSLNLESTQFCVAMTLDITDGGSGQVYFRGLLDHGPFPPTIAGFVTQSPTSCLN